MTSTATKFFATGAIFALCGMVWGIQMSATHDHTLSPAHGHLNLIGFVAMSVFGTYYALTPKAAEARLALAHYALTVATVLVLTPGIALAISGQGEALAKVGSVLAVLSMALFAFVVLRHGVGVAGNGARPAE
jgi:cbb3-type cytochrome oxidase subunit 1